MANAKNPSRSFAPLGESSRRQKMVARITPVMRTAPNRIPKSSGIRREFISDRIGYPNSAKNDGRVAGEPLKTVCAHERCITNGNTPPFASRDAPMTLVSNDRLGSGSEAELVDEGSNPSCLFGL
ncbi:hypothetical protein V2J09_010421 [Rumex salicifolius]